MLQVSTGIYFRDGVELYETEHRRPMFCNLQLVGRDQVDIGIGSMSPETSLATDGATALWVSVVERLEATRPDGTDEFLVSTGGEEIYEDLAAILSFAFNAVFDLDHDRARRLIRERSRRPRTRRGAFIGRMFESDLRVTDEEIDEAKAFIGQLLALSRPEYERALRAIKGIVNAARRCVEDPTQAYTDYVASLEALSEGFDPPGLDWERLDSRKRKILEPALQDLSPEQAAHLQAVILEVERAGSKHRFVEFVRHHLTPDFYREELPPHVHPIRPTSLPRALARAYQVRSESVHSLKELVPEAWVLSDGAHTVSPAGGDLMLTHEGIHRVCLHVVRSFVSQGPTEVDESYNYRENLPNVVRMQLAPQYYMWRPENMTALTAPERLDEVVSIFIEVLSKREEHLSADMRPALERIEELLNGPMDAAPRRAMLAIYFLWHWLTHPDLHRPDSQTWMEVAVAELNGPSLESLTVAAVIGQQPHWSVDEWCDLAEDRHDDLKRRRPQPIRPAIDALLWVEAARALSSDGSIVETRAALAHAVECMPGDRALIQQEKEFEQGGSINIDLRGLVFGAARGSGSEQDSEAGDSIPETETPNAHEATD